MTIAIPGATVTMTPIAALKPFVKNPREHTPAQVKLIARSITEFGWTMPVLADADGEVIAGHGRLLAAATLGLTEAPVVRVTGWSKEQRSAYRIADNKLTELGGWDMALVGEQLQELIDANFDPQLTGFDSDEIFDILKSDDEAAGAAAEETPEPPAVPVSKLGDLWVMGNHRIICGDSTNASDVTRLLNGVKPQLMVTDPPYGVEYDANWRNHAMRTDGSPVAGRAVGAVLNDDRADWTEAWKLFPGDVAYVWHAGLFSGVVADSLIAAGFKLRSQIVWAKSNFVIGRGHYHWGHETAWYAVRDKATASWSGDRTQSTLWKIDKPQKSESGHSTQKPVECMRRPMQNNSSPGDTIYEPFSGSGTSIIAAELIGRHCCAVELNPPYVDVAVTRWQVITGLSATLDGDGRTFDEIMAERLGAPAAQGEAA